MSQEFSHGRGRWFEPSRAHQLNQLVRNRDTPRLGSQTIICHTRSRTSGVWRWPPSENAPPTSGRRRSGRRLLSPIPGLRGIGTSSPVGHPPKSKTFETRAEAEQWARAIDVEMDSGAFISRAEAESNTLKELLERHLAGVPPLKKGAEPETNRLRLMMRPPLAGRFVAGVRGVDIARWRDERSRKVAPATVKRDPVLPATNFPALTATND